MRFLWNQAESEVKDKDLIPIFPSNLKKYLKLF